MIDGPDEAEERGRDGDMMEAVSHGFSIRCF